MPSAVNVPPISLPCSLALPTWRHTLRKTIPATGMILLILVLLRLVPPALAGETVLVDGIPHVMNPATPRDGVQTLDLQEQWRTGGEDDEIFFGVVTNAISDDEGNIYLLDMQLSEVQVYSPAGEQFKTLSREGEGPGEIQRPADLLFMPDGSLGIVQMFPGKVVKIDLDGNPAGSFAPFANDPTAGGQCKGWVEADVYGRLHFLWYHTPSWPTSASSWWSVRYRYSDDYGATFSPSIRLSDSTFQSPVTFLGEYHIMETDSQYIRAVWTDGREGDLDLWYAQAELSQIGVVENPFRRHRMPGVTLHVPALLRTAAIPVELWLKRPGSARLSVFDATGRQLAHRDLGRLDAGTHRVQLHGLPAGRALFVKLTAGETATARTLRLR